MIFASDNWAGVAPNVARALAEAGGGFAPAYGGDPLTIEADGAFAEIFEREVAVFFVATGTAANMLALAAFARPSGVILCHRQAHIVADEAGAPEFQASARLHGIEGGRGKIEAHALRDALAGFSPDFIHHGQPMAVSISETTEVGAAYTAGEIGAIAEVAQNAGIALHMDGARFAAAVAGLGVRPADITWRAGVDVLSFGGTKNGCWAAEAVVFFDRAKAAAFPYLRKRAGHLFSKSRFVAAQFAAYLRDGYWLDLARHANAMAARLSQGIAAGKKGRLVMNPDANEVFAILPTADLSRLRREDATFYEWSAASLGLMPSPGETVIRLVTSFATTAEEVDRFVGLVG